MTEKPALVGRTCEPGMIVSLVARHHGVGASVPAAALAQISQLKRLLGMNLMENVILVSWSVTGNRLSLGRWGNERG